ncbi:MAG: transglutaminase family protein [Polyangiales bacterium]
MTDDVDALEEAVEALLDTQGLALTMGGEPTFIPRNPNTPEWTLRAIGSQKLGYARRLAARLLRESYPGGLVMQVHGKQYPGEVLPRWVVLLLHRDDGVPLWSHPELLLLDDEPALNRDPDARRLMNAIAEALELESHVLPCIEKDGAAETPRGWALPLDWTTEGWVSDVWPFSEAEPIVLVPGTGPLGVRLPLGELDEQHLRRAFTLELKEGALHLFLPPLSLDGFVALASLLERVAVGAGTRRLVLCGYRPEDASEITSVGLAADPGVLEVNLPPARRWREYDRVLQNITRAAESEGLFTTRYYLNGEVQGTGGGAHVLFGGPTLDENPFFQRPDLVSSILRYWQRHPALSYFFSGQYVGPGSQAPRADETLIGKLYELETACLALDGLTALPDRVFLDRLFRSLMTDSAGNTHRAEICLDKLWNYDSPTGLQGLIELRAFETMPEVSLQSLSALFVRAIVAMLAAEPCTLPLIRHGARLHDAFMLPTVLWHDLCAICEELAAAGLAFDLHWLAPVFEHRFPLLGRLALEGGDVLVRQALETWPLLAEMADGGATSRVVDNSTDRVEISVADQAVLRDRRIVVNGFALRLRDLGPRFGAGVRYKSASGWPALHPHIAVQSPLQIEAVDRSDRVLASARYYYWKPDGSTYDGPPRDLAEAKERQKERWLPTDERRGAPCSPREPVHSEECEYTLDLRRQTPA